MDDEQRAYDLEFAKDTDERTPEQIKLLAQQKHSTALDAERQEAVNSRRTSGIDDRLVMSHMLYEGQKDSKGNETFDKKVDVPQTASRVYFNFARQITNDGAAQIGDLLFPNDDRNYGLRPGPIAEPPLAIQAEPATDSSGKPLTDEEGNPLTNLQAHTRRLTRAQKKCDRMFKKVDAALIKSRFPTKARKVIFNGALYGTGVLKGPVPMRDGKGRWAKKNGGSYSLRPSEELSPEALIVNPFDFYPDGSATCVEDARFFWEKTYMDPAALESAKATFGFRPEAVDRLLLNIPSMSNESETEDPVEEAKNTQTGRRRADGRYIVWERRGTIERAVLECFDVTPPSADRYFECVVYICDGEVLKIVPSKYEANESIYSVFCWDDDPLSIFGYGIPWLIDHPQRVYNSAWQMALDNGGMSAAPQVIVDKAQITPADSKWELRGGKVWFRTGQSYTNQAQRPAFETQDITQNLNELWAMMDRAVDDAYELSGVTRVEKAQGGLDNAPVTLGATQIIQNNTTVSRRALARRWDDDVTLGLITRFYDYFMQFDKDDDIKAHMVVEPRGATVLLAKELQASNYMRLYDMTGGGAVEGMKPLELLRAIAGVMQVPEGRFVETEDETMTRLQKQQDEGQEPTLEEQLETRKIEVEEAKVELEQAKIQLESTKIENDFTIRSATVQLQELQASANFDDKAQARADALQKSLLEGQQRAQENHDKVMAELPAKEAAAAASLITADNQTRELDYKMTTGNEGI